MNETTNNATVGFKPQQERAERCETCAAFCPFAANSDTGTCRREVPQVILVGIDPGNTTLQGIPSQRPRSITESHSPMVGKDFWCLRFTSKAEWDAIRKQLVEFDGALQ